MKYCHSSESIPAVPHYAVICFKSIYIPGDERSRTCPGHGYPAGSEETCDYIAFHDINEMQEWVQKELKYSSTPRFVIIKSFPKTIITTHQVQ